MTNIDWPMVTGWSLGSIASIIGIVVACYACRAAKAVGGEIGRAFIKVAIGVVLVIVAVLFFGYIHSRTLAGRTTGMVGAIGVNILLIPGFLFMLAGFRGIIKSTKI